MWKQAMYDLLQRKGEPGGPLMILEENNIVDIRGLAKIRVENEMEALKLFFEGEKLRSYGRHLLNQVRFFYGTTPFHGKALNLNSNQSNLFSFIEDLPHFSTSCHAKMSLTLNELIYPPKTYRTWKALYPKRPTPSQNPC